jgi:hypothetical protein
MQEANIALLFLRPLNGLGLCYMVTGSMAPVYTTASRDCPMTLM